MSSLAVQQYIGGVMTYGVRDKIEFWSGYSFGWPSCLRTAEPWTQGCVVTPKWGDRAKRDLESWRPIMLDNGAFSAWANSAPITLKGQVCSMKEFASDIEVERVRWVILPDVVGDGDESYRRSFNGISMLRNTFEPTSMLWPIQEGSDIRQAAAMWRTGAFGGFFVGGRERRWKMEASRKIRQELPTAHIHVGRISSDLHLMQASQIPINSFDTTSFSRQHNWNKSQDYAARLRRFCKERS